MKSQLAIAVSKNKIMLIEAHRNGREDEDDALDDSVYKRGSKWTKRVQRGEWSPAVGLRTRGRHQGGDGPLDYFPGRDKEMSRESERMREETNG